MNFDALFNEMYRRGYSNVRYSLFKGHMRGDLPDGTTHYYRIIDGDILELIVMRIRNKNMPYSERQIKTNLGGDLNDEI